MHPYGRLRYTCAEAYPNTQEPQSGNRALSANKGYPEIAGRVIGGMPVRIPLIPVLGGAWITNLFVDARALGIPHNADYVIPLDLRAFSELGVEPGMATVAKAETHIRTALQMAGFFHSMWSRVQRHTAKRSGMRIFNTYTGGIHEMKGIEKMHMAHHRAVGPHTSAGAHNPYHLVGPVLKAKFIWPEWLAMCQVAIPGRSSLGFGLASSSRRARLLCATTS